MSRGGLVLAIPVLWLTQDWGPVAGLPVGFGILHASFLISTLTQFFAPAEQATTLVVERRHLLSANSLYDHDDGFGGSGICGGEPHDCRYTNCSAWWWTQPG